MCDLAKSMNLPVIKRGYPIFLLITMIPLFLWADDAPVVLDPIDSSNVIPVYNNDIRMVREHIDMYIEKHNTWKRTGYTWNYDLKVKVEYEFKNTGKAQNVTMGFPNSAAYKKVGIYNHIDYPIEDFTAIVDGQTLPVVSKKSSKLTLPEANGLKKYTKYECFEISFAAGEKKRVINTYSTKCIQTARYVLETGALWKGRIDQASVTIHLDRLPRHDILPRTLFSQNEYTQTNSLFISPGKYKINDNKIEMIFKNIEPDFNIEIGFQRNFLRDIWATSTLDEENFEEALYSGYNLCDGKPETCWAEGKSGSGENERVVITLNRYNESNKKYPEDFWGYFTTNRIGIINGYAKSEETFKNNNRAKKIKITIPKIPHYLTLGKLPDNVHIQYPETAMKDKTFIMELKDTAQMQYLQFDEPVPVKKVELEILEVYRGEKYNDTCISEVSIEPAI